MKHVKICLLSVALLSPLLGRAELAVAIASRPRIAGQKAIVPLALKNEFSVKIESARAVCFLLDDQGKMVGQSTKWVIGGAKERQGLAPGTTNAFYFVITADKPFTTTNLTAKVQFSRVVLEGGTLADVNKAVRVRP